MKKGFIVTLIVIVSIVVLIVGISLLTNVLSKNYTDGIYTFAHYSTKDGWSYTGYKVEVTPGDAKEVDIPTTGHRGIEVKEVFIYQNELTKVTIPEGISIAHISLGEDIEIIELPDTIKSLNLRVDDMDEYYEYGYIAFRRLKKIVYGGTMESFKHIFSKYDRLPEGVEIVCVDGKIIAEGYSSDNN